MLCSVMDTCYVLPMSNADRDFAAEYLTARLAYQDKDANMTEQGKAHNRSERIATAAERAGVRIDCIGIDEAARVQVWG